MKIASAAIAMQGEHFAASYDQTQETLRSWLGPARSGPATTGTPTDAQGGISSALATPTVQISASGKAAQAAEASDAVANDPLLGLIKAMVEWLTGKSITLFGAAQLPTATASSPPPQAAAAANAAANAAAPSAAGFGIEYERRVVHEEIEQTRFAAQGKINTADGRQISFTLDLSMARHFRAETAVSLRAGAPRRQDPLVINFAGAAAQLSDQRFRFDLQGDGKTIDMPLLGSGSGYLALDLNHNGRIDSGHELFGPASGSGFADLARYDQDHNGWIDESDAVFNELRVWRPAADGSGGTLSSLQENRVGALYLGHARTDFALRNQGNQDLGVVRDSGIYLDESGQAGSLQDVDITL